MKKQAREGNLADEYIGSVGAGVSILAYKLKHSHLTTF